MTFYTVKSEDNIYRIARSLSVSAVKLMEDNGTLNPGQLTAGDCLVCSDATQTYTVKGGDTLLRIADRFGVSCGTLLRNNPSLYGKTALYPGQNLSIRQQEPQGGTIVTTAFVNADENAEEITALLPYLTNLCIRSGELKKGKLEISKGASSLLRLCKDYGVHAILCISNEISDDGSEWIPQLCDLGYHGILLTSPPSNAKALRTALHTHGLSLYLQTDAIDESSADAFLLPQPTPTSYSEAEKLFSRLAKDSAADKIIPVISSYGYDKALNTNVKKRIPLSDFSLLAAQKNTVISYDRENAAFFQYLNHHGSVSSEHFVFGENAKSIAEKAKLLSEHGFRGICIDGALPFYAPLWLTVHSLFHIVKGGFGKFR